MYDPIKNESTGEEDYRNDPSPGVEQRPWHWPYCLSDLFAGVIALLLVEAVYFYTAAPCVTMEDSGESISAIWNFGVCHPPGYPLWTFLAFLFTCIMPGNAAWVCNIFCGLCGALGVGLGAMMISSSLRWFSESLDLSERTLRQVPTVAALTAIGFAATFGLTLPYWSQATVTATYCFHCFLMLTILATLYWWARDYSNINKLVVIAFAFSLSLSNHQLTLSLIPPAVIFILLTRPYDFIECSFWLFGVFSVIFFGFAWLGTYPIVAGQPHSYGPLWNLAIRQLMTAGILIGLVFWFRGRKTRWRLGLALLLAVVLGLSPYGYEPIASSTNPPMNWSYTREPAGFFYAINRSQYGSALSDMFMGVTGRILGARPPSPPEPNKQQQSIVGSAVGWASHANQYLGHTWMEFFRMVPWPCFIFFFIGFASILVLVIDQRAWVLMVMLAFLFTAFFLGLLNSPPINNSMWLLEVRWHGTSLACLLMMASFGFGITVLKLVDLLEDRVPGLFHIGVWVLPAICLLFPADLVFQNWNTFANQRGHWWGWHFGYDMLADLPKDSVVYGGTDPGRFVPTYMIMVESFVPTKYQHKPFDRRDLYIITQNAMADAFYNRYFRGHYGVERPDMDWWLPRLFHRKEHYPTTPLILPTDEDLNEIINTCAMQMNQKARGLPIGEEEPGGPNSLSAKWVWEHNKDKHDFFVEESFPMFWSYPYATPHGLCYQIHKDPVEITPEMFKKDYEFWENYIHNVLMCDPNFLDDPHARRGFSKLRETMGNIYNYRKMTKEAEAVYLQALEIYPGNDEASNSLFFIYTSEKRIDDAYRVAEEAYQLDPHDGNMQELYERATAMRTSCSNIIKLEAELKEHPDNIQTILQLFQEYCNWGDVEKSRPLADRIFSTSPLDPMTAQHALQILISVGRMDDAATYAMKWKDASPDDPGVLGAVASVLSIARKKDEFLKVGREAIEKGGVPMRIHMENDPINAWLAGSKEFQWMLYGGSNGTAPTNAPELPKKAEPSAKTHKKAK